jgi:dTDP-4-dehydrorhamnose reductase
MKVLLLGSRGILGRAIKFKASNLEAEFLCSTRQEFDVEQNGPEALFAKYGLQPGDYVLNATGITKARIDPRSSRSITQAVSVNSVFPNLLAEAASSRGVRVIQVGTDCVYAGRRGQYLETDPHDAEDVYGKTKSLGESPLDSVMTLRTSFVGSEVGSSHSFYAWIQNQPKGAIVHGFTNHIWSGVTSGFLAEAILGLVTSRNFHPGVHHLVPGSPISKFELAKLVSSSIRPDLKIEKTQAPSSINRSLSTSDPEFNREFFRIAGFANVPSIAELMASSAVGLTFDARP